MWNERDDPGNKSKETLISEFNLEKIIAFKYLENALINRKKCKKGSQTV